MAKKTKLARPIVTSLALGGAGVILTGLASLVISTAIRVVIWTGKQLERHDNILAWIQSHSGFAMGLGMIAIGTSIVIIKLFGYPDFDEDEEETARSPIEPDRYRLKSLDLNQPVACKGCKNYHGVYYYGDNGVNQLICCIHPYGWHEGNCPDYEKSY
jgi:hypothetical protein